MSKDIFIIERQREVTQIDNEVIESILSSKMRRTNHFYIIANDNLLDGL